MNAGYTKLFSTILASSVWSQTKDVKILWITMLAMCDRNGFIPAAVPGLADMARLTLEETENALAILQAPDRWSRTPDNDGRRIEAVQGGLRILNYKLYREKLNADERRIYLRDKQREHRRKSRLSTNQSTNVNNCQHQSTHIREQIADSNSADSAEAAPHADKICSVKSEPVQAVLQEMHSAIPAGSRETDRDLLVKLAWLIINNRIDAGRVRQCVDAMAGRKLRNPMAYLQDLLDKEFGRNEIRFLLGQAPKARRRKAAAV